MGMDPVTLTLIAGTMLSVASTAYSAYSQEKAGDKAKDAANLRADQELEAAGKDAANIREKAARLKGQQSAALAASGVSLGTGSADVILGETERLSEQDALAVLKEGGQRADLIRSQGQLTSDNYTSKAIATALGGASSILGGVTSYQEATKGARTAKNIDLNTDKALATRKTPTYSLLGG